MGIPPLFMALKIRLARAGRKKRPFYRLVVAEAKMPRDGRFIERLGSYDPLLPHENPLRVSLNKERISYWLSVGAQPSERVALFLSKAGLVDAVKQPVRPKKSAPGKKAVERQKEKEEAIKAKQEAEVEPSKEA